MKCTEGRACATNPRAPHGIELVFFPEALEAIADRCLEKGVGARGLYQTAYECVSAVDYRLPELWNEGIRKIIIGPDVLKGAIPVLDKSGGLTPQAEKLRRSAFGLGQKAVTPEKSTSEAVQKTEVATTQAGGTSPRIVDEELEKTKTKIGWLDTKGSAAKWWEAFESENVTRPKLVLRLAQELAARETTITNFFKLARYIHGAEEIIPGARAAAEELWGPGPWA